MQMIFLSDLADILWSFGDGVQELTGATHGGQVVLISVGVILQKLFGGNQGTQSRTSYQ